MLTNVYFLKGYSFSIKKIENPLFYPVNDAVLE